MKRRAAKAHFEPLEPRLLLAAGDSLGEAIAISVVPGIPTTVNDAVTPLGDVDYYVVTLRAGQRLIADVDAQSIGSGLNSRLRILDAQGVQLAFSDDTPGSLDSFLNFTAPHEGIYYLEVTGAGGGEVVNPDVPPGGSIGPYRLKVLSPLDEALAAVSGLKWSDFDGDGVRDPGEPALAGVRVYLDLDFDALWDEATEPSAVTAADGSYAIDLPAPGSYRVREVVPENYTQTAPIGGYATTSDGALEVIKPDPAKNYTYRGNAGVSTDGLGTDSTGNLQADIPEGAAVQYAFLHVTTRTFGEGFRPTTILFEGQEIALEWITKVGDGASPNFETGRANVTAIVAAKAAGGGAFDFAIDETVTEHPEWIEGTSLTVIYSREDLPVTTIAVLDGGLTGPTPQTTRVDFLTPPNVSASELTALMALGIGYGFVGGTQFSTVSIDGAPLTNAAGGADDSNAASPNDGNLVTVGGVGNSIANPADPNSFDTSLDDELYDLRPFINASTTKLDIALSNPSEDDSIFLMVLTLPGEAEVTVPGIDFGNQPDEPPPELGAIQGVKWNDLNGNQLRDPGEPGYPGVRIYLDLNLNGVFDLATDPSEITAADGSYSFVDLEAGTYVVRETDQGGALQTFPGPATDFALTVLLDEGEIASGVDFGNREIFPPPPPPDIPRDRPDGVIILDNPPPLPPLAQSSAALPPLPTILLGRGGGETPPEGAVDAEASDLVVAAYADLLVEEDKDDLLAVLADAAAPDLLGIDPGDPPEKPKPPQAMPELPATSVSAPEAPIVASIVESPTSYSWWVVGAATVVSALGLAWRFGPGWVRRVRMWRT